MQIVQFVCLSTWARRCTWNRKTHPTITGKFQSAQTRWAGGISVVDLKSDKERLGFHIPISCVGLMWRPHTRRGQKLENWSFIIISICSWSPPPKYKHLRPLVVHIPSVKWQRWWPHQSTRTCRESHKSGDMCHLMEQSWGMGCWPRGPGLNGQRHEKPEITGGLGFRGRKGDTLESVFRDKNSSIHASETSQLCLW